MVNILNKTTVFTEKADTVDHSDMMCRQVCGSDLRLAPAPPRHRLEVEVRAEYEDLWVPVWVGCYWTGPLFPNLTKRRRDWWCRNMKSRPACCTASTLRCSPCFMTLLGPLGCWGGGGGGGGGEPWSWPCGRSAVPYTARVRLVYQPRSTRPSVFTCTHTDASWIHV